MRGAKGIHHKDITQARVIGCQGGIVSGLAHVKAHVFQQDDVTGKRRHLSPLRGQQHIALQQLPKARSNGRQRGISAPFALNRSTKMRHDNDRCALI